MTISEQDYDEQVEMRLANEILQYTYPQVYDVGCDEIEAEAGDYEERFIYFGSLESFQSVDAGFSDIAWQDWWREVRTFVTFQAVKFD